MAGELAYDPTTGQLVYSPATGQLALDCREPAVEPCTRCAAGTTPEKIYITFAGIVDCGQQGFDATSLNGSWELSQLPELSPCLYGYEDAGLNVGIRLKFVVAGADIAINVDAGCYGIAMCVGFRSHGKIVVDGNCRNPPSPVPNDLGIGDCAFLIEGYGGTATITT